MPADDHTAPAEYRELSRFAGYRFGDDGSVWSRWIRSRLGQTWKQLKGRVPEAKSPYRTISLKNSEARRFETRYIHRLIAEAFIGPCPDGMEVRHKNGIKPDCRADNLEYGTRLENVHDRFRHGHQPMGEKHYYAKFDWPTVRLIRRAVRRGIKVPVLARRLGLVPRHVHKIARYEIWKPLHLCPGNACVPGATRCYHG